MKNIKRTVFTAGIASLILFTAACSTTENVPEGSETMTPTTTASATVSSSESDPGATTGTVDPGTEWARTDSAENLAYAGIVLTGDTLQNKNGTYPKLAFAEDSQMAFKPAVWDGANPDGWTDSDVAGATKFMSDYLLQEVVDSPVNGDGDQLDAWLDRNLELWHSQWHSDLTEHVENIDFTAVSDGDDFVVAEPDSTMVNNELWHATESELKSAGYGYFYDGTTPRVNDFAVNLGEAHAAYGGAQFVGTVDFTMNGISESGDYYKEPATMTVDMTVGKDADGYHVLGLDMSYEVHGFTLMN